MNNIEQIGHNEKLINLDNKNANSDPDLKLDSNILGLFQDINEKNLEFSIFDQEQKDDNEISSQNLFDAVIKDDITYEEESQNDKIFNKSLQFMRLTNCKKTLENSNYLPTKVHKKEKSKIFLYIADFMNKL